MIEESQEIENQNLQNKMIGQQKEIELLDVKQVLIIPCNNRTKIHIHLLIEYIKLLQAQLPNMPYSHLSSVLFSPNHQTLIYMNFKNLLCGLTFRHIKGQRAFQLSLMASSQIGKGYGSYLINFFKTLAQDRKINIIATHADNSAIGFYQKMGFTIIQYTKNSILGEKQFSDSTIMQARINPHIDYMRMKTVIRNKRDYVLHEFKKQRQMNSIRSGNYIMKGQYFKLDPQKIEGIANFWDQFNQQKVEKQQKRYRQYTFYIDWLIKLAVPDLVQMNNHLQSLTFLDYQQPIQLQKLKQKAVTGIYCCQSQLWDDLIQFINNSKKFYKSNPKIIENILLLQQQLKQMMNK